MIISIFLKHGVICFFFSATDLQQRPTQLQEINNDLAKPWTKTINNYKQQKIKRKTMQFF